MFKLCPPFKNASGTNLTIQSKKAKIKTYMMTILILKKESVIMNMILKDKEVKEIMIVYV